MLAYQRKRFEVEQAMLREELYFFLELGRFSDKIMEIVKKNNTFFWGQIKEICYIEKLSFNI